ncbi:MAG: NAD-dependent epimerase/dehydratase family protein [Thermoplasmataceae archaeon]|jgi:UDP-glucose 4-epimerase
MESKKIIVTGGAGFIGTNLVRKIYKDNDVTVIDNLHTGSEDNLNDLISEKAISFIKGDVKNIGKLNLKADQVFHLGIYSASPMYRENPFLVSEVISGMTSVLEFAKKNNAKVVFASTSSIYNGIKPPHREDVIPGVTDYYTEARIAAERLSELYFNLHSIETSAMRFFSIYGKYENAKKGYANLATQFLWNIKRSEQPVIYGDGTQRRDFVYAEDVADALVKATAAKGYQVFNVGSGKNYDLNELVAKINKMLGTSIKPKYIEMPVKNYVMETLADTTKSEKVLGFKPKVGLDEGLKKIDQFYR